MKKRLIPVVLLTFVNSVGFSILIPVLPFVVEQYGGGPILYGMMISAYSLFQFLAAPLLGALSDKYGRRPILLLSQAGTLLSWIIFGIAYFIPNIELMGFSLPLLLILISRITDGATGGNISVTNAYAADISSPEEKTKVYGLIGAMTGVGFLFGPVIGGLSMGLSIGYLGTVIVAAAVSLVTLVVIELYLTESLTEGELCKELDIHLLKEINIWQKMKSFTDDKWIKSLFVRRIFFSFAFASYTSTFALFAKDVLNFKAVDLGLFMLAIGIFSILNQTIVVPRMAKIFGNEKTFNLGQLILAGSICVLVFRPELVLFGIASFFTNLGLSMSMPTLKAMLSNSVNRRQQGQISGIDESLMAGNNALAPLIAGTLYGLFSILAFPIFAAYLLIPFGLCAIGITSWSRE